ncbi:MAG: spermidine synthase [Desulfuromonas sp.]|nr:MAG: spermidine synthase [Desulfuromonas sp.]
MAQPWNTLATFDAEEGLMELRQRGAKDFLITVGGLVLMNSRQNRSEVVLGQLGCEKLGQQNLPRVLVGGLGMGYTLKAVLDSLTDNAEVTVAELNPTVVEWCRGPLAVLTDAVVDDPRVMVEIADVAQLVKQCAARGVTYDAVVFDLYKGPHAKTDKIHDPLYGRRAIDDVRKILNPGGRFVVWGENYDQGFDQRLQQAGFMTASRRPGKGGYRHVVFVADCP